MEILNFFNCYDHYEARQKEQEYFISLNATLNSIEPMPKPKQKPAPVVKQLIVEHICKVCNVNCHTSKQLEIHNETNKHKKHLANDKVDIVNSDLMFENTKTPKNAEDFYCMYCHFKCCKKSDWERHCIRPKHTHNVQRYENDDNKTPKNADQHVSCNCGKIYKYYSGLWRHQKNCVKEEPAEKSAENQDLIAFLIKQNSDLQKQILEVCKNSMINNTTNNLNSHNKTFNLQVFLNEDCKDAMNITEFVNSIQLQLSDLEHVGQVGYVEGISDIIVKNLKALDVTKRPVHCTDPKRETIYIKDGDVWEKDEDDNKKLRKMIKSIAFRNCKNTRLFKEKYPECMDGDSKYSDIYNKIIVEVMGGGPKSNDIENQNKIIRKIAKVMTIDKNYH